MAIKPRTYVSAPAFTPLPFGLLTALSPTIQTPADPHWQAGVQYESVCAVGDTTFDECFAVSGTATAGPTGPPPSKAATTEFTLRGATPFTVYTQLDCSTVGFWDRSDDVINQSFTQSEQWQVERAFWTGMAASQLVVYPHLAADEEMYDGEVLLQPDATILNDGTAIGVAEGIGRLEAALADCYDGVGIIHVPRALGPALTGAMLLVQEGARYRTPNGNIVVMGSGYTGSAPDGTTIPDNSLYVYATGAMMIYRSPTYSVGGRDALDRANNTLKVMVERNYLLGWDCCLIGVNISLGS